MDWPLFLNAFTGLFVIVDPIGAALIFHAMIPVDAKAHRRKMALKAVMISTVIVIIFGLYGEPFLKQLGININAIRISGGLLLFYTAFHMITAGIETNGPRTLDDISVYPISIPLLAGPGTLTLSLLLFSRTNNTSEQVSIVAAIIATMLLTLVLMLLSKHIKTLIGNTGDEILRRFLGVILAALAIQFIYDGIINIGAGS